MKKSLNLRLTTAAEYSRVEPLDTSSAKLYIWTSSFHTTGPICTEHKGPSCSFKTQPIRPFGLTECNNCFC